MSEQRKFVISFGHEAVDIKIVSSFAFGDYYTFQRGQLIGGDLFTQFARS